MSNFRKFGVYILIGVFAVFIASSGMGSCSNKAGKSARTTAKPGGSTYEPKFRKDAEGWLVSAESGDTLTSLNIEYADTPERIEFGMMYRKSMTEDMGMLFFMGDMQMRSFWMKNTYVSLDIIYLDDKMQVVSIQKNAEPQNTRSLPSTGPAMYVLEVKGGLSDTIGLKTGDVLIYAKYIPVS